MDALTLIPKHALIQMVIFVLVYMTLARFVFGPILKIFAERDQRMTGDREEAKHLVERAEGRIREYEERVEKAKAEGKNLKGNLLRDAAQRERDILSAAREEGLKRIAEARKSLEEEGKNLLPEIAREADSIGKQMAGVVLGRAV